MATDLTPEEKLRLLEERLLLGQITEGTYLELRRGYAKQGGHDSPAPEQAPVAADVPHPDAQAPGKPGLWVHPSLRAALDAPTKANSLGGGTAGTRQEKVLGIVPRVLGPMGWSDVTLLVTNQRIVVAKSGSSIAIGLALWLLLVVGGNLIPLLRYGFVPKIDLGFYGLALVGLWLLLRKLQNPNKHRGAKPGDLLQSKRGNYEIAWSKVDAVKFTKRRTRGFLLLREPIHGRSRIKFSVEKRFRAAAEKLLVTPTGWEHLQ